MTAAAALLTLLLPLTTAALGLPVLAGRSREMARDWAVLGTLAATAAAVVELVGVLRDGPDDAIGFLGRVDTGGAVIGLNLRADSLSAVMAVAVGVVATSVQLYSVAYLRVTHRPGDGPERYPGYAATVSLFTAAMMLVVHAADLVLLVIGWELMGLASYLLIGHHSERPAARAAAVKAFLVTRVGDVGVLLAVVVLLIGTGSTSIGVLNARAAALPDGLALAAALLLLAGVAGKSAQFPLHTWLPDAMEGPTPISALIHAATMVAAGVFLVVRLLPLFLAAPAALAVAAVLACVSMLGAALAAAVQDDLKRLLAWSTISQVGFMLAAVSLATGPQDGGTAIFHLLAHAAFKSLLFLVAGCAIWLAGTGELARMAGTLRHRLGLAGLAGLPPFAGFWSKEAVLGLAERAAHEGRLTGWLVYLTALATTLVTGVYAGRAWAMVAAGPVAPAAEDAVAVPVVAADAGAAAGSRVAAGAGADGGADGADGGAETGPLELPDDEDMPWVPVAMITPLVLLAVPTAALGLVLLDPPSALAGVHLGLATTVTGTLLSLTGVAWAASAPRAGVADLTAAVPARLRRTVRDGYGLDAVQRALVVRPVQALARAVGIGDRDVVDAYPRGSVRLADWVGLAAQRMQTGLATGYLVWVLAGAALAGLAGVVLT